MTAKILSRRHFLGQGIGLIALAILSGCTPPARSPSTRTPLTDNFINDITVDIDAATRLGQAYLSTYPDENDLTRLREITLTNLTSNPQFASAKTDNERFTAINATIKKDYIDDAIVQVNGWFLSRTEARLYALIALGHGTV